MMARYVFNVAHILIKDWLKCIVMENGVLYVIIALALQVLQ